MFPSKKNHEGRKAKYLGGIDAIHFLGLDETSADGSSIS